MRLANMSRFRVGLIGLGVLAFVAALVGAAAGLSIGTRSYSAMLQNTGGLRVGEEVQVAGVSAGDVTGVELEGEAVRVTFTMDSGIDLGADTRAEVKVATLLGTHFLLVTPEGEGDLADGTIPMAQTKVPYNLQDVIDDGVAELQEFDTVGIERSLRELTDTLDIAGDDLGPALDGVQDLSALIARRSGDLNDLLSATRKVTRQLTDATPDLITLMEQGDLILDTLRSRRETIRALLRDMTELGEELAGVIRDNEEAVAPTLRDLDTVVAVLERHERTLNRAITMLPATTRYFANSTGTGPWLALYMPGALPDGVECVLTQECV